MLENLPSTSTNTLSSPFFIAAMQWKRDVKHSKRVHDPFCSYFVVVMNNNCFMLTCDFFDGIMMALELHYCYGGSELLTWMFILWQTHL